MSRKPPGGPGHSHKHAGNPPRKHRGSAKHNPGHHKQQSHHGGGPTPVVVKGKHPHHHKARGWSPGSDVACCTAEALGLLLGWGWDEVLALYWRTASDPDSGASILDTLEACGMAAPDSNRHFPSLTVYGLLAERGARPSQLPAIPGASLILGVTLPEPHAIAVTPGGNWWSWGEPFNPFTWPDLVVEEAWALCL